MGKVRAKKSKKIKVVLIWSIGFSNRPWLFIFIGWSGLIPQEILLQDLNLLKSLVVLGFHLDRSDRSTLPVRPVGCCRTDYSVRPVRPLGHTGHTGLYCLMPILVVNICPLFFGKACVPKNTLLDQNCLRAMNTSAIFCAKGDNNLSAISCSLLKLMTKPLA